MQAIRQVAAGQPPTCDASTVTREIARLHQAAERNASQTRASNSADVCRIWITDPDLARPGLAPTPVATPAKSRESPSRRQPMHRSPC